MVSLIGCLCLVLPQDRAATPATDPAGWLPPSTVACLEVPAPNKLVATILNHPLQSRIRADKTLGQFYASPQWTQVKAGVAFAEAGMGMKWQQALEVLAGKGIVLGFDPETNAGAAILSSGKPEKLGAFVDKLLVFAAAGRKQNNQSPIKKSDYRGVTVHRIDQAMLAVVDGRIVVVTNQQIGRKVVDAILDKTQASPQWLRECRTFADANAVARLSVNVDAIRRLGGLKELAGATKGNPFGEFLVGGILDNLSKTPMAVLDLTVDDEAIAIQARTPHKSEWVSEPREFFFGPGGSGRAPVPVMAEKAILNFTTHRDVAAMWRYAGDLFNQQVNDAFAEAESNLSTLFAGKDLVDEILGQIEPDWQLVVDRQEFANRLPRPALELPSFAIVGRLKNPAVMKPELRRTFQSVVGFFNVVGAMEGNPQLDQDVVFEDDVKVYTSTFVPTPEDRESKSATVHYNFTPSLAFSGDHFVLSSSLPLAQKVAGAMKGNGPVSKTKDTNLMLRLRAAALRDVLNDNREQLIVGNMLEEGRSREEAEQQIDLFLNIVSWFDTFSATLKPEKELLQLRMKLSFASH